MNELIGRRRVLLGAGAAVMAGALPGCATVSGGKAAALSGAVLPAYTPTMDRIAAITVCSRPFRAAGPRIEVEKIGQQNVVHSYGHGGSGWSLSWGTGQVVAGLALGTGEKEIGVIGCGAIGLTTAVQLQRAGAKVAIYAKDLPPNVLSAYATGVWSPGSRIGMVDSLTPAFKQQWQSMTRTSWRMYQNLLGLPGNPIEFVDNYYLQDAAPAASGAPAEHGPRADGKPRFAELDHELVPEIGVAGVRMDPAGLPFAPRFISKSSELMFNIPAYSRMLIADFRAAGGRIVIDEFRTPADFARLPHKTIVNATGIGARELMGDVSVVPVRGQLAHMVPQPGVNYGVAYNRVAMTPRRDGFVLQVWGEDDYYGYGDPTRNPDMAEAELAVKTIASAFRPAV